MTVKQKHLQQILPSSIQNLAKGVESNPARMAWIGQDCIIPVGQSICECTSHDVCSLHSKAKVTASSPSATERATPALLSGST